MSALTCLYLGFCFHLFSLLTADFAAAAVLITFGALLGKTSPLQMIAISFIEIVIFTANEYIGVNIIKVFFVICYCLLFKFQKNTMMTW